MGYQMKNPEAIHRREIWDKLGRPEVCVCRKEWNGEPHIHTPAGAMRLRSAPRKVS